MTSRLVNPVSQFFDSAGAPLIGGKLAFFEPETTTPKETYSDAGLSVLNTNPVILNADGRIPDVFFNGAARVVLTDINDVQIWERDPVSTDQQGGQFSPWDSESIYSSGDVVRFTDSKFYRSVIDGNTNRAPVSTNSWERVSFIGQWLSNVSYNKPNIVIAGDDRPYLSLSNGNQGNNPEVDSVNWLAIAPDVTTGYLRTMGARTFNTQDDLIIQDNIKYVCNPLAGGFTLTIPETINGNPLPDGWTFALDLSFGKIDATNPVTLETGPAGPDIINATVGKQLIIDINMLKVWQLVYSAERNRMEPAG